MFESDHLPSACPTVHQPFGSADPNDKDEGRAETYVEPVIGLHARLLLQNMIQASKTSDTPE